MNEARMNAAFKALKAMDKNQPAQNRRSLELACAIYCVTPEEIEEAKKVSGICAWLFGGVA